MTDERAEVLVIGAGPAGLAIGACLKRRGVEPLVIERGKHVGDAWHRHYERLHLHTVKQYSALPYMPFPRGYPQFPSRAQVAEYLAEYAKHFELNVRIGCEARDLYRDNGAWVCETNLGRIIADQVVVATGYNRTPNTPHWPDESKFRGSVLHSATYRNGEPFHRKRVLVVGIGNTGAELALDLVEHGAIPTISVRSGVNIVPREFRGRATQGIGVKTRWLPNRLRDFIARKISRAAFGDIAQYGLKPLPYGPIVQIERYGRIPIIDVGTIAAIRDGRIKVAPDVARFTQSGVVFADGTSAEFDHVILATGFRADITSFLRSDANTLDERGYPASDGESSEDGLYFIGFARPRAGILREIAQGAPRIARQIATKRGAAG